MKLIRGADFEDVVNSAKHLLGCIIVRKLESGQVLKAKIVETESYHQDDPASHTFSGPSPRTTAMFGEPGHAYIYFTYGMHWCLNVTAGPNGYGAGVLIRAVEPLSGIETMKQNRNLRNIRDPNSKSFSNISNGPAKLAQALVINKSLYGHDLTESPLQIFEPEKRNFKITQTTRIGISKAVDEISRFYITDNRFVSKK